MNQGKPGLEPENPKEKTTAAAEMDTKKRDHGRATNARSMSVHTGKGPADTKRSTPKGLVPEKTTQAKELTHTTIPSPASPREDESPLRIHNGKAPGLPPSGLAPSDEMRLLQEARESARAAAEASGSGRRPRPPSRKALEASGKLVCNSIQWMTKEKREEEARFKLEMKEQRKAAAAAGLKFGHRIEALALSAPVGVKAEEGGTETRGGETLSADAWTGINAAVSNVLWRKLTPAETLLAAGKQPSVDGAQLDLHDSKVTTTKTTSVTLGTNKQSGRPPVSPTATSKADVSERKRKVTISTGESIVQAQGTKQYKHARQARRTVEGGDRKGLAE